jgi:S-adenosylmethionine-diacylglycerol 3-amino-3-carboxypropyl transferase
LSRQFSLFGLGIPPAQYEALAGAGNGNMAAVIYERLERLACGFRIEDNYFAWQAFGRGYSHDEDGPLPPYLRRDNFPMVRDRASRVEVMNRSFTEYLERCEDASRDRYILLDAQDWMNDAQLNVLWREITRTAKPGARVIFRTAAKPSLLPGRVAPEILARWNYREAESLALSKRDRSAIYGGFHLYVLN